MGCPEWCPKPFLFDYKRYFMELALAVLYTAISIMDFVHHNPSAPDDIYWVEVGIIAAQFCCFMYLGQRNFDWHILQGMIRQYDILTLTFCILFIFSIDSNQLKFLSMFWIVGMDCIRCKEKWFMMYILFWAVIDTGYELCQQIIQSGAQISNYLIDINGNNVHLHSLEVACIAIILLRMYFPLHKLRPRSYSMAKKLLFVRKNRYRRDLLRYAVSLHRKSKVDIKTIQYTYGQHSVDSMNFSHEQQTSSSDEGESELADDFNMILPEDRFMPQLPTIQSIDETVGQQLNGNQHTEVPVPFESPTMQAHMNGHGMPPPPTPPMPSMGTLAVDGNDGIHPINMGNHVIHGDMEKDTQYLRMSSPRHINKKAQEMVPLTKIPSNYTDENDIEPIPSEINQHNDYGQVNTKNPIHLRNPSGYTNYSSNESSSRPSHSTTPPLSNHHHSGSLPPHLSATYSNQSIQSNHTNHSNGSSRKSHSRSRKHKTDKTPPPPPQLPDISEVGLQNIRFSQSDNVPSANLYYKKKTKKKYVPPMPSGPPQSHSHSRRSSRRKSSSHSHRRAAVVQKPKPKPMGMSIDEWLYTDDNNEDKIKPVKSKVVPSPKPRPKPSHIAKNATWTPTNNRDRDSPSRHVKQQRSTGVRGVRGMAGIFEKDSDDENQDNNAMRKNTPTFKKTNTHRVQPKKVKPYTGDPTIWNAYLDKNGTEPTNEWQLHKFVKSNKDLPTISFKEAREMYKGCKGRGKL